MNDGPVVKTAHRKCTGMGTSEHGARPHHFRSNVAPYRVIYDQEGYCSDRGYEDTVQIKPVHPEMAQHVKQPPPDDSPNNTQQHIKYHSLAAMVDDVTRQEACD